MWAASRALIYRSHLRDFGFRFFGASAFSTSCRIASGREGLTPRRLIQVASFASSSGRKRTKTGSPLPIAGRPRFFGISDIVSDMTK
jgi:hypothetical protein